MSEHVRQLREEAELAEQNSTSPNADVINTLYKYLHWYVIEELQTLIFLQVHSDCEGCKVNHPSQTRHQLCLFTPPDVWVDFYLDMALQKLDLNNVMDNWYPQIEALNATVSDKREAYRMWTDLNQEFLTKMLDDTWKDQWKHQVQQAWTTFGSLYGPTEQCLTQLKDINVS